MKAVLHTRPNGRLSITWPILHPLEEASGMTYADAVTRAVGMVPRDHTDVVVVDGGEIPEDRTFLLAWVRSGDRVTVDMDTARGIHRDYIRALREPLLVKLDVEYQRADEQGDAKAKAAIAARKQILRDATKDPAIDAAKTPNELKAVVPDALKD